MQEVSADEIERLIQAVAFYCGISPTGSKTTGANPQNSWSAGGDPLENLIGKEYTEWDLALYMDILPGVSSQRKWSPTTDLSISTPYTTTTSYLAA